MLSTDRAEPGEVIEVTWPDEDGRGLGYVPEKQVGDDWDLRYFRVAGTESSGERTEWFAVDEDGRGWDDIGIDGPGPDLLEIPEIAELASYLVCATDVPVCVHRWRSASGRRSIGGIAHGGYRSSAAVVRGRWTLAPCSSRCQPARLGTTTSADREHGMDPSHANLHQAENQAHGHESQVPWRRGRLGVLIPVVTLVAAAAFVVYAIVIT